MKFLFLSKLPTAFALSLAFTTLATAAETAGLVDMLVFGDAASEQAHRFNGENTKAEKGALDEPVRISLPKQPLDYYGGDLEFVLKVDPVKQNYFTVKFWGSDVNDGQKALLYINGEQLGYRHLGDYEALNHGASAPSFRDRFFYYTSVLPLHTTRGRTAIDLTIRTIGPIAGYQLSGGYDGYQKKMEKPSRGYYRVYSHTTSALSGLDQEKQGAAPTPPVRPKEGEPRASAEASKKKNSLEELLKKSGVMAPNDLAGFGRTAADVWQDLDEKTRTSTLEQLVAKIDLQSANAYEPTFFEKGIYQGDWGGSFAPVADAITEMNKFVKPEQWKNLLEEKITVKGENQTRRSAWTRMIKGNFDYARTHVARITNQAMFCLHGAYRSNRALLVINPAVAEPEESAKRFIFEAAGIIPYRGNDILDANGKLVGREDPFGAHYMQITDKGLTREFTYVAIYGEVANEVAEYWERYGYEELLKKALLTSHARAQMKYSDFDDEGFRSMRMEGVIESRGPAYPDDIGYVQRKLGFSQVRLARHLMENPEKYKGAEWDIYREYAREIIGQAQQMLRDNHKPSIRGKEGLADYEFIKKQPPAGSILPHTNLGWYSPAELVEMKNPVAQRHAWADEDNGTISLRDGDLSLFAGLVMKANWGINGIARVHCITPTMDRLSTVVPDVQYDWQGKWSVRPDWTNVQFMNANNPPEGTLQVLEGEILPFASQPQVKASVPVDTPYVGYGNFYSLHYLNYLIGMNTTRQSYGNARSYQLKLPAHFKDGQVYDFISQKQLPVQDGAVEVGPQSTVILAVEPAGETVPMSPRLAAAFTSGKDVAVHWIHAAGAEAYVVKRSDSRNGPWKEIGRTQGSNQFTDADTAGKKAFYTVAGVNANGTGLESPIVSEMPSNPELVAWFDRKPAAETAPPEAPRELTGENIKKRINLKWKVARRGVTYQVKRAETSAGTFRTVASGLKQTSWTDEAIEFNHHYYYQVVAIDSAGKTSSPGGTVDFSPVNDTLPAPWKGLDIGNTGAEGSDGLRDTVFSIRGSGGDVWGNKDEFRFVHQDFKGDGEITVHITLQQNTSPWTKSGIMIRSSADPGAANVFLFSTPGWGIVLQQRAEDGKDTMKIGNPAHLNPTPWLRLKRKGESITASASADGKTWQEVGTVIQKLPKNPQVGLAVNSHSRGAVNLTQFDHVSLSFRP